MTEAEVVLGLCREFHCLPSQVEREDVRLLRLLSIEEEGTGRSEKLRELMGG